MVSCSDFGHLTSVGLLNLKEAKRRTQEEVLGKQSSAAKRDHRQENAREIPA